MNQLNPLGKAHIRQILYSLLFLICLGGATTCQAETRYSYSADGAEVTDSQSGLIWRRCSQGQSWSSSTCTGSATLFTHEQALAHAKTQTGWRLPNAKELMSLHDLARGSTTMDTAAFPNTPAGYYWSSTPFVRDSRFAFSTHSLHGTIVGWTRNSTYGVRLVR